MQITQTIIHFPDIELQTRDAHKLRGYFGNLFKEHSPLLHKSLRGWIVAFMLYPLVQYKVIDKMPVIAWFPGGCRLTYFFVF